MAMQDSRATAMLRSANRATIGATAVLLLTTVHHLHGARVYRNTWRRHAAIVSTLATAVIGGSLILLRRNRQPGARAQGAEPDLAVLPAHDPTPAQRLLAS
jgi:hypothetical protein